MVDDTLPVVTDTVGTVGGVVDDTLGTVGDVVDDTLPVDDTVGTVGGVVNDTLGTVGDVVGDTLPAVNDTLGTVGGVVDDTLDSVGDTLPAVNDTLGTVGGVVDDTLDSVGDTLPAVNDTLETVGGVVNDTLDSVGDTLPAVNDTLETVGDVVQDTLPAVNDTLDTVGGVVDDTLDSVADALPAVNDTVGQVGDTVTDLLGALEGTSLLDLDANLDLDLDLAAPISAAVAANANVAVPIDAAVSANALSPDATSLGTGRPGLDAPAGARRPRRTRRRRRTRRSTRARSKRTSRLRRTRTRRHGGRPAGGPGVAAGPRRRPRPRARPRGADRRRDRGQREHRRADRRGGQREPAVAGLDLLAIADQDSVIVQTLQGVANATTNQTSTIEQGETRAHGRWLHERRRPSSSPHKWRCWCWPASSLPSAQADPLQRHQDNVATAVIEQDGGRAFDLEFEVLTQRGGDDVDNFNAAQRGRALHRVPGDGDRVPDRARLRHRRSDVTPHNRAVAINDQCTQCVVVAEARQFVRVVDEPVKFTDAGRAVLADVRRQLTRARGPGPLARRPARRRGGAGGARAHRAERRGRAQGRLRRRARTCSSGACCRTRTSAEPDHHGRHRTTRARAGDPRARRRRRADRRVRGLRLQGAAAARASRGRPDDPAHAAALSRRGGRRRPPRRAGRWPPRSPSASAVPSAPDNVRFVADERLRPLGVLALRDGTTPELPKREAMFALRCRRPIVPERAVNGIARMLTWLHWPAVKLLVLLALAGLDFWLFGVHGIAPALRSVIYDPTLLLAVLASTVVAAAWHECGHASACRYGGARPGVDRRRALPGLARVLLRRDRGLPARPHRPAAHRPRRRLLQRDLRARGRRRLLRHRAGGVPARGVRAAHGGPAAAAAAAALRRLLRAQRPHRRAGHPVADQADLPLARARGGGTIRASTRSSPGSGSS